MERGPDVDKLPTMPYIDIMAAGAKHFGVYHRYIEWLEAYENQPCRLPNQFEGWKVPEGNVVPVFTELELDNGDGKDGREIYMCCNGKVRQWIGPKEGEGYKMSLFVRGLGNAHAEL